MRVWYSRLAVAAVLWMLPLTGAAETTEENSIYDLFIHNEHKGGYTLLVKKEGGGKYTVSIGQRITLYDFLGLKKVYDDITIEEKWENGCLTSLDYSRRKADAKNLIQGRQQGKYFVISNGASFLPVRGCVQSLAYWNWDIMRKAKAIFIPERYAVVPVTVAMYDKGEMMIDNQAVPITQLHVQGDGIDMYLNYDAKTKHLLSVEDFSNHQAKLLSRLTFVAK